MNNDFSVFMDNELHLLHSCSIIPDNSFDDYQAQAMHSATYMLWLIKVMEIFLHMQFVMSHDFTVLFDQVAWMLMLLLPASANP